VTDADLDYQGSITLDPAHCEAVGILPLEFVEVWNKHSGARLSTYVIYGERGSGCCVLNGAAARTCQRGDPLIIVARARIEAAALPRHRPRIALFAPAPATGQRAGRRTRQGAGGAANTIEQLLEYRVGRDAAGRHDFRIVPVRGAASTRKRTGRSARSDRNRSTRT
jgi:aspartate 1-decarboxylase